MPVRAVLVAALVACVAAQAYPSGAGTVYLSSGALVFKAGAMDPNGVAWGNFTDQVRGCFCLFAVAQGDTPRGAKPALRRGIGSLIHPMT